VSLAAGIAAALALEPAERIAFAHRARTHVAAGYTREQMCARTIDVYEELLFPQPAALPSREVRDRMAAASAAE
jgi:hypothetical protein